MSEAMIDGNPVVSDVKAEDIASTNGALLSIKSLKVWFELRRLGFGHAGYVHAVDDVTFDVAHSEAIAVVGESGCGKSSLMKTILGLYKPTEGNVVYEGQDLGKMEPKILMVPHPGGLCPAGPLWGFTSLHECKKDPI